MIALVVLGFVGIIGEFEKIENYTTMTYDKANDTKFLTGVMEEAVNQTLYERDVNTIA